MFTFAVMTLAAAVSPGDVPTVQSLMELAASQAARPAPRKGDALPIGLLLSAMAQAEALVESEGVPLDGAAQEWLRLRMVRRLEAELAKIPTSGRERRNAWDHLVRVVTTPWLAQQVLDEWLELVPLSIPQEAPTAGTWAQAEQLEGTDTFALERVTVIEEIGSAGLVNALIDPGEWVHLEVTFVNATALPWFSTTAFPQSTGCLWVNEKGSSAVGEMAPGGQASVLIWAYVPPHCTQPSTLRLSLADTHRGSPAGTFSVSIKPTPFVRPRAARARIDTDALGSSDGSQLRRIGPSMAFEFVSDVSMPGDSVVSVDSQWAFSAATRPLFSALTYRATPAVSQGNGVYLAGDDVDGRTVDEKTWAFAAQHPSLERWMLAPASGRVWLAMDTTVVLGGAPRIAAPLPALKPTRSLPTRPGGKTVVPQSPRSERAPEGAAVAELVKRYVEMTPHNVTRESETALSAVSGYELEFDRSGFIRAYETLLAPPQVPNTPATPTRARYVVRSYLALPALPVEQATPREEVPTPAAPPPAPVQAQKPRTRWVQLDLGGGTSILGTATTASRPNLWQGKAVLSFPMLSARAFVGPHVVGVLAFHFATLTLDNPTPATFTELSGDIGGGYRFRWERLSFTPYAALLLRLRRHSQFSLESSSIGAVVGLNSRVSLTSWLGLVVDVAAPFSIGGPSLQDNPRPSVDVVSGLGARLAASLSVSF